MPLIRGYAPPVNSPSACALAGALAAALSGCVPMVGTASLSLLTRSNGAAVRFEPVGPPVSRSECLYWALLWMGGHGQLTHETVVERILDEAGADVLLDAQFYTEGYGFPYIFMMQCATVEGQPAKVVER